MTYVDSNTNHVLLHIRTGITDQWITLEVVKQWHKLFKGTLLSQRYAAVEHLLDSELKMVKTLA